jgi:hypothetical protein
VKGGPQPPKSAIESHLRFAESFRVHGPISTSEFAAVSTPPPQNNSLRYKVGTSGATLRGPSAEFPLPHPQEMVDCRLSLEMAERRDRRMCRLALQSHLLVKSDPPML